MHRLIQRLLVIVTAITASVGYAQGDRFPARPIQVVQMTVISY